MTNTDKQVRYAQWERLGEKGEHKITDAEFRRRLEYAEWRINEEIGPTLPCDSRLPAEVNADLSAAECHWFYHEHKYAIERLEAAEYAIAHYTPRPAYHVVQR